MRAQIELGFELIGVSQPDCAVDAVSANKQIAILSQRLEVLDLGSVTNLNVQLFGASLKYFQQSQPGDAGKTVAVNRDLLVAMNNIDVVPRFKLPRNLRMRLLVRNA